MLLQQYGFIGSCNTQMSSNHFPSLLAASRFSFDAYIVAPPLSAPVSYTSKKGVIPPS
jgi:hypothetical protein